MSELSSLLAQGFVQHALIAAILVSIAAGIVGALVVVNRLVFMAGGIAHTAYGGVGTAVFFSLPVLPVAAMFTALAALLLGILSLKQRERVDTLIGVIWAAGMAFGLIMIDLTPGYNTGLMGYLFGSILTVSTTELWMMAGLNALILALTMYYYRDILSFSFDPTFARTRGIPATGLYLMLMVLIAQTVVMMIQIVGLLLVLALLTLPPYLASRYTHTLAGMMYHSAIYSLLFCLTGLLVSYYFDMGSGPAIIAVACIGYLLTVSVEKSITALRKIPLNQ
ncbi:MAG TPA: metal ABC transporter permease [Halothiobacillaceae bacterium]|nr:metal ABC transporter permease [Halothiobacillaceae bacterium]